MAKTLSVIAPELLPVPAVNGGAVEQWIEKFVQELNPEIFDVQVVSRPAVNGKNIPDVQFSKIKRTVIEKKLHNLKNVLGRRNPFRYLTKGVEVAMYGCRAMYKSRKSEIIYLHNEPSLLLFGFVCRKNKIILHMHNDHLCLKPLVPLYRLLLRQVDRVFFVSEFLKKKALEVYPEFTTKFEVVFNAVDIEFFKPYGNLGKENSDIVNLEFSRDEKYILFAGRLVEIKGAHILIEAFQLARKKVSNLKLIICGSSFFQGAPVTEYQKSLYLLASTCSDHIFFKGYIPQEELKFLYSAADIFVCPSIWDEPQGLVALEAMSSGTALIASATGGLTEVVHCGVNGVLVEPGNVIELSDAIVALLTNPAQKKEMESNARELVRNQFTWPMLVRKFEAVVDTL